MPSEKWPFNLSATLRLDDYWYFYVRLESWTALAVQLAPCEDEFFKRNSDTEGGTWFPNQALHPSSQLLRATDAGRNQLRLGRQPIFVLLNPYYVQDYVQAKDWTVYGEQLSRVQPRIRERLLDRALQISDPSLLKVTPTSSAMALQFAQIKAKETVDERSNPSLAEPRPAPVLFPVPGTRARKFKLI